MEINWKRIIALKWFKQIHLLFIYGFFLNFSPISPFRYDYYLTYNNITEYDLTQDYIPIRTYATSVQLIFVFLFVDISGYDIFNIFTVLYGLTSLGLVIWGSSSTQFIISQIFLGWKLASQVSYYVCIYAYCDRADYQLHTSLIRAAPLIATIISALLGFLFVSTDWLQLDQIVYFDFSSLIVAIVLTIFLPRLEEQKLHSEKESNKLSELLSNFKSAFPNKYVVRWTLWSAFSLCGYHQVLTYVHPLWKTLQADPKHNGLVEGLNGFAALIATLLGGFARFDWKYKGDLILSLTSLVQGFMLLFMSQFERPILNYTFYILYDFIFNFVFTILTAETAKFLGKGCFGIVFGGAALAGMTLNSAILLLNDKAGFPFSLSEQFMIYGFYHLAISCGCIVIGLTYWFAKTTYE